MDRVVITGCGAVSPAGVGVDKLWTGSRNADGHIPTIDLDVFPSIKGLRRLPAPARWSCLAAAEALGNSGGIADHLRAGVLVGTNRANMQPIQTFFDDAQANGPRLVNPILFPETVMNAVAGHLAIRFGLAGPTATFSGGRLAGMQALHGALDWLMTGRLSQAVVCSVEPQGESGDDPSPYPKAEGCGVVVLELASVAKGKPLAEVERVVQRSILANPHVSPWDLLATSGLEMPDEIICPRRLVRVNTEVPTSDPWEWTGDSDGAASLFALMAGVQALKRGCQRVWVVESDERTLTAVVLRSCAESEEEGYGQF